MLSHFLVYLQPTQYFQLYRKEGSSIYPIPEMLPKDILEQLELDERFKSPQAQQYDLSWQAVNKGYIGNAQTYTSFEKLPIVDEYHFLRKYFNPVWVLYVLMLRILSFKNPFQEISAYRKTRSVKRSNYLKTPIKHRDWDTFESSLLVEKPLVSVIIPTLNRYEYLKDVLEDLEKQDYKNFEVIVVDQSAPYQEDFYKDYNLDIQLSYQEERALWLARNNAVKSSRGEYVLLFDDDSRVEQDWISNHMKCLDFFESDISSGVSLSVIGAEIPESYSFFCYGSKLDTGNVLIKKQVFRKIGLFDRQFEKQRMGDGEFGLRSYLHGFKNISNPYARRVHLKVGSGGLREMGSWDAFRPKNILSPRPIPSVLYLLRKYFGRDRALLVLFKTIPPSVIPYKYKKNKKMLVVGVFISVFLFPFVLLQVGISWRLASVKLKEGAKISGLDTI